MARNRRAREHDDEPLPKPVPTCPASEAFLAFQFLSVASYEREGRPRSWNAVGLGHDGKRVDVVGAVNPTELLDRLLGRRDRKTCGRCGNSLPLDQFSRNRTEPDGRARRCRPCEALRVRTYERKRRARQAASANGSQLQPTG